MRIRPIYSQRGLRLAVANLHGAMEEALLHPWDHRLPEYLEQAADVCWTVALALNLSPHQCLDRYCHCHIVLGERKPPTLPGF